MTVVETRMSLSPAAKADMTASFSFGFIFPWSTATRRSGKTSSCRCFAYAVTALRSSGTSSPLCTSGQTMNT